MTNFIKKAYDELFAITYFTPKKVIDYIKKQQIKAIIGNPPYGKAKK